MNMLDRITILDEAPLPLLSVGLGAELPELPDTVVGTPSKVVLFVESSFESSPLGRRFHSSLSRAKPIAGGSYRNTVYTLFMNASPTIHWPSYSVLGVCVSSFSRRRKKKKPVASANGVYLR